MFHLHTTPLGLVFSHFMDKETRAQKGQSFPEALAMPEPNQCAWFGDQHSQGRSQLTRLISGPRAWLCLHSRLSLEEGPFLGCACGHTRDRGSPHSSICRDRGSLVPKHTLQ